MKKKILLITALLSNIYLNASSFDDGLRAEKNKNYFKAKELYKKACENGSADGCNNLGTLYENGQGVKRDYFQAKEFYKKACNSNNLQACSNLGFLYQHGKGIKQDYHKAKKLFEKTCEGGIAQGCNNYALLNKQDY